MEPIETPVVDVEASPEVENVLPVEPEVPQLNEAELDQAKEEVKSMVKNLNIKVDGKSIEKSIDLANEAELIKIVQMAEMANKRAQEAADLRKAKMQQDASINDFLGELSKNPSKILKELGLDVNKFAEEVMAGEIEKLQLSPEQRELQELKAQLEEIKNKEEKYKKENESREAEALRLKYETEMERDLLSTIDEFKLPQSMIPRLVGLVSLAHQNGIDLSFKDVAPMAVQEYKDSIRSMVNGIDEDELFQILSEERRKNIVAKAIPKKPVAPPPVVSDIRESGHKAPVSVDRTKSARDFFKDLNEKTRNK